jgi:2-polyprenyl-6-methoxyphenol hydroxylase-like FAD-dependent oxidoreductase
MLFRRQALLDLLYRRLPERETRILANKKVEAIEMHASGVRVRCDDGSVEEGSIAVGCDGVHSKVRGVMRELALASSAKTLDPKAPMVARYQLLAGHSHRISHMEPGRLWEIRNNKFNMQVFMLEKQGWFFVYRRLPEPAYEYTRYTNEDAEAFARDVMDRPVTKDMTFKNVWEARKWATVVNIEEGLLRRWYWDRIVLAGDSVHKMTPNSGLAVNQGWQGVVALTNVLRRLLSTNPEPDVVTLTKAFQTYQSNAEKTAKESLFLSKLYIRVTAWDNLAWKMADHASPYFGGDLLLNRMLASPIIKKGLILDDVPEANHKAGSIPWENKPYKNEDEVTAAAKSDA